MRQTLEGPKHMYKGVCVPYPVWHLLWDVPLQSQGTRPHPDHILRIWVRTIYWDLKNRGAFVQMRK